MKWGRRSWEWGEPPSRHGLGAGGGTLKSLKTRGQNPGDGREEGSVQEEG